MSNWLTMEVTTAPATEPVTTSTAKSFMKVDSSDDDTLIGELIAAARQSAEDYLRRKLITQTLTYTLDRFPQSRNRKYDNISGMIEIAVSEVYGAADEIRLPFPPLQSVTSITTYDTANSGTAFSSSNYFVDTSNARIALNSGQSWPTSLRDKAAIKIVAVVGYGDDATDVPQAIRSAILFHIKAMYDSRMICDMPGECRKLLDPYRIMDGLAYHG